MKDKTSIVIAVGIAAFVVAFFSRVMMPREHFFQQEIGAPVAGNTDGLYNGIDISNSNMWSSTTAPTPLKPYDVANDSEIFAFQESTFKPECCPAGITNDSGCICMTEQEQKALAYRGGNRVSP
jgi:hypothetical protein